MRLTIDTDKNQVSSATQQTTSTGIALSATRIFLGTAIGMSALAMGFAMLAFPKLLDSGNGGGGTKNKPLKVTVISNAVSMMDQNQAFASLYYKAKVGNSQYTFYSQTSAAGESQATPNVESQPVSMLPPLNQETSGRSTIAQWLIPEASAQVPVSAYPVYIELTPGNTAMAPSHRSPIEKYLIPEASAQATPFSIEDPPLGFPAQMVTISYMRDATSGPDYLTLCIGQSSESRLYIGSDGSTYTDSKLTNRTTSESCDDIKNRSLKFSSVTNTEGSFLPSTLSHSLNILQVGNANLGLYNFANGFSYGSQVVDYPSDTPLTLMPEFTFGDNYTTPEALIRITGAPYQGESQQATLCMPSVDVTQSEVPARYFFDTRGNAYSDVFLTQPVVTEDCVTKRERMLRVSSFTDLHLMSQVIASDPSNFSLGHFDLYQDQTLLYGLSADGTGPYYNSAYNPIGPFGIHATAGNIEGSVIVPQTIMHLAGHLWVSADPNVPSQTFNVTACTPSYSLNGTTGEGDTTFYFDQNGEPYTDIFLTNRALKTSCTQSYNRGLHVTHFTNATVADGNPGSFEGTFNFNFARTYQLGSIHFPSQSVSASTTTSGTIEPLMVQPVVDSSITTPVHVPYLKLNFQGGYTAESDVAPTPINTTLCLPAFSYTPSTGDGYKIFYYDTKGQPYEDLLLTKPVLCTSGSGGGGGPSKLPAGELAP